MFAVSVGVVILPKLAQSIQRSGQKIEIESQRIAAEGVSLLLLLITPCFLMLFIVGEDICNILYGWGRFSDADVHQTALALQAYSVGLFGYGLIKVLMSIYYAIGRTKFTLVAAAICVGLNAVVNYNLVSSFGHRGLAATSSVVLSIQALLLVGGLYSTGIFSLLKKQKQLRSLVWKTAISVVVLYAVLQYGEPSYLHSLIRACICGSFCAALFWGPFLVQLLKKEGKK